MKNGIYLIIFAILLNCPSSFADQAFTFEGVLDISNKQLDVDVDFSEEKNLSATFRESDDNKYHVKLDMNHIDTLTFDVSSEIESIIEIKEGDNVSKDIVVGTVWSNYSMVDFKPVKEMSGTFKIEDNQLFLNNLAFASVECNGGIQLDSPNSLNLVFDINYMDMEDFLKFWMQKKKYDTSGQVAGKIRATGNLDELYLKGNLESYNGFIKDLDFDSIVLNIEGIYPYFIIDNSSSLSKVTGMSFSFFGPIDFSDRKNFKRQLKKLNISPLVKQSESNKEWTIKRLKEDGADSAELKYFMRKEGVIGSNDKEEAALFGIERAMQF